MRLSRIVIKNLRTLKNVDVQLTEGLSLVVGENNVGKSSLLHGLRLCLDVGLSSSYRMLLKDDVYCELDQTAPFQVMVGVEFSDFEGNENEEALLHGTQIGEGRARLFYRFRPKRAIREVLVRGELGRPLMLSDYGWELFGGGNPAIDLTQIEWNTENSDIGATSVGLQYLQSYLVVFLPALRDVEADLQQSRKSLLMRLIEASNIDESERQVLINAVRSANEEIEASPTIKSISQSIDSSLKSITGPAFNVDVDLGLSSPTFQAIVRNLIVLLSKGSFRQFEPRRNGLGLNNILYIAVLIEHFKKRAAAGKSSGELILIEEPEAHLHPQLQSTLVAALRDFPFQVIVTTHSTQITSKAALNSFIFLTQKGNSPSAGTPSNSPNLTQNDHADLERYLDATKSNILFARKVMLVEGAAESLLLPPLVKKVLGIDLEREGISVIAIHGVHFGAFSRLFSESCLSKKCAIVADADLAPEQVPEGDDPADNPNLSALEGPYVKAFVGATTFEREITLEGNIDMLIATVADLGAPLVKRDLDFQKLLGGAVPDTIKDKVLRTAKRFGKARFAQVAARHVDKAESVPTYIVDAINWLRAE